MESRVEQILEAFASGDSSAFPKPQSRAEEFLIAMLTAEKETDLPIPRSRVEALLKQAADTGVGNGSDFEDVPRYEGPCEVTPSAASDVVLRTAQKLVEDDIIVKKISYSEVPNDAGGITVTIG